MGEMVKERITLAIDKQTLDAFRFHCKKHALKLSSKIELMIKKELAKKPRSDTKTIIQLLKEFLTKQTHPRQQKTRQPKQQQQPNYNPKKPGNLRTPSIDQLRYKRGL